jgi:hypothetical protein
MRPSRTNTSMSLFRVTAFAAAFVLVSFGCRFSTNPAGAADPADLLPLDNDISGFLKKGSAAIMTDQQSIYNAINGDAVRYIDYGFMEGVKQLYSNGGVDIDVQVFNHGTAVNAEGIFRQFQPPSYEFIDNTNALVLIDQSLPSTYQILYQRDNIFMRITTTQKTDFALNMAKQFYRNIDNKIGAE